MNKSPTLSVLMEDCLSEILALITSPRDACNAAAISKSFKSAADSDAVWERFLPQDYREVLARAAAPVVFVTKKQLYRHLSESYILLDHGYLGFKLDKKSGKKCYMLGAKYLTFYMGEGGDDCLEWGRVPESRFADVAIIRDAWPLDIQGKIASVMLSGKTTYVAYLVYQTTKDSDGLSHPSHTSVNFRGVWNGSTDVMLKNPWKQLRTSLRARAQRKDGWTEFKLGEFYYDGENEGEVEMAFEEYEGFITGVIVEGIELRPK